MQGTGIWPLYADRLGIFRSSLYRELGYGQSSRIDSIFCGLLCRELGFGLYGELGFGKSSSIDGDFSWFPL